MAEERASSAGAGAAAPSSATAPVAAHRAHHRPRPRPRARRHMPAQRNGDGTASMAQTRAQEPRSADGASSVRGRVIRVKRKRAAPSHDALIVHTGEGAGDAEDEHPAKRGREVASLMASLALDSSRPRPTRRSRRCGCHFPPRPGSHAAGSGPDPPCRRRPPPAGSSSAASAPCSQRSTRSPSACCAPCPRPRLRSPPWKRSAGRRGTRPRTGECRGACRRLGKPPGGARARTVPSGTLLGPGPRRRARLRLRLYLRLRRRLPGCGCACCPTRRRGWSGRWRWRSSTARSTPCCGR